MTVAFTIIMIVALICGTILMVCYWTIFSKEVNQYTLNDVRNIEYEMRQDIKDIKNDLEQMQK